MGSVTVQQAMQMAVQQHQAGNLGEAERIYRMVLQSEPEQADALHLLGVLLGQTGRMEGAIELVRKAIAARPHELTFQGNLGRMLVDRGELEEAIGLLRKAAQFAPSVEVHNSLGYALQLQGQLEEAMGCYQRALKLNRDHAGTHYNIANTLREMGRLDEAIVAYRAALRQQPSYADAHNNLGNALKDLGYLDEAMASYREASRLRPDSAGFASNVVYTTYFHPKYDDRRIREELEAFNRRHGGAKEIKAHGNVRDPERRLRVGYVSPNFWQQAECYFVVPLLEAHDRAQWEIHCYATMRRSDAITERLKACAQQWHDVEGLTDAQLAEKIRADGIDVLVDLTMHMAHNALPVFARKPAPVQVAWLAYPGSTGLTAMDYRLTDAWMDPVGEAEAGRRGEGSYSEQSMRLPDAWCCYQPLTPTPEVSPLPAASAGYVTFGSLNNFCKVNDSVLGLWARVMGAVGGKSRLLMLAPEGSAREKIWQFMEKRGIGRERVMFEKSMAREQYLRQYERIDLGLDPFPYNGITTTCDALWMGVPVLTMGGARASARAGVGLLQAAGAAEFVCASEEELVEKAKRWGKDLPGLAAVRAGLRARVSGSALMDGVRFARHVEAAYREVWRRWCGGGAGG